MAFVSCTMSSARSAPFTWFHEEHCKLQRRCPYNGVFEIGRAPAPRSAQGLPGVFRNRAVCGDNLVASGIRMRRPLAVRYRAPRCADSIGRIRVENLGPAQHRRRPLPLRGSTDKRWRKPPVPPLTPAFAASSDIVASAAPQTFHRPEPLCPREPRFDRCQSPACRPAIRREASARRG